MQRRLRLAVPMLVGVWLLIVGFYRAASAEPIAPLDPTTEDCTALSHEFYQLLLQLNAEMDRCTKDPPIIGQAYSCRYSTAVRTTVAWVQCADIDARRCELNARRDAEYNLCMSRVKRHGGDTAERKVVDTVARADQLYGRYKDTVDLIRDPKAYLKQAFQDKLFEVYRQLFPSLYGGGKDDIPGISALYNYAHQYAEKGLGGHPSPIVGHIQKEAFDIIAVQHKRMLATLDQLRRDIVQFDAGLSAQNASPFSASSFPRLSQPSGGDADCAVLRDERASRAFMERDIDAWRRLVQRCERPQ